MKKLLLVFLVSITVIGCRKDNFVNPPVQDNSLKIDAVAGIKLKTQFVTSEVEMNVKVDLGQNVTVKILDISNRVVSKEQMYLNSGDNILKLYTSALLSSAYRIGLYDQNNKLLGITDFNKI